jgi:S1-C subfamily serine protease
VQPGSPAADAGLRPGMIIEKVGESAVATPADVAAAKANWANPAGVLLLVRSARGPRFLILGGDT